MLLESPSDVNAGVMMERQTQDGNGNHGCDNPLKYPVLSRLPITHWSKARLDNLGERLPKGGHCLSLTLIGQRLIGL